MPRRLTRRVEGASVLLVGDGVAVVVVLPDSGPALAYSGGRQRVREVLDRLHRDVEERLKGAGLRTPSAGELPSFRGKPHYALTVEKVETKRTWRGKQERRTAPPDEVIEEIKNALEGVNFPAGCFIVTGTSWARVGDLNKGDRDSWLNRGAGENDTVKHWTEMSRISLSKHQGTGRLP